MDGKRKWSLFHLVFRSTVLFVGLMAFVNYFMTHPLPVEAPHYTFEKKLSMAAGTTKFQVRRLLRKLAPAIADELKKGNEVTIPGMGTYRLVKQNTGFGETKEALQWIPDEEFLRSLLPSDYPNSVPSPTSPVASIPTPR